MTIHWRSARRFRGRLLEDIPVYTFDYQEKVRQAEVADWRREYRKTMLLKALGGVGLIILICGGTLSVLCALNW